MDDISNAHINFCKVETFNGGNDFTTGGWVAETYLGFGRVCCVLYSLVTDLLPPSSLGLKEFQCVVQSLFCVLSRLMTSCEVVKDEITDHIKLFLSFCQRYHAQLYSASNSKNPFWNSPNYLSLLNLPSQIEQFGSMRLYWEGVNERYIQYIKPHLKNMRTSTSFLCTKLDHIHRTNILKNQFICPLTDIKAYQRFKDFKQYRDLEAIKGLIANGKTLVGIVYKLNDSMNGLGLMMNNSSRIIIIKLKPDDNTGYHLNNMWFTRLTLEERIEFECIETTQYVEDCFVAVSLKEFDDKQIRYTIITKSWHIRNLKGEFRLPTVSKHNIESRNDVSQSFV